MRTLVIIPTYNEAENIHAIIDAVLQVNASINILVVDDNSQDGTGALVKEKAEQHPQRVSLLSRSGKLGLGTAYIAGFKWGLDNGYDALIEMDADFSHEPAVLSTIVKELETNPVVVGSRYTPGGGTADWGVGRKLISRCGGIYARFILGMQVRDLTGGFNGWRADVLRAIDLNSVKSQGYSFQIELKYRAHCAGYPIKEIPILFRDRRAGQSKMSSAIVLEAMLRVWALRFK